MMQEAEGRIKRCSNKYTEKTRVTHKRQKKKTARLSFSNSLTGKTILNLSS